MGIDPRTSLIAVVTKIDKNGKDLLDLSHRVTDIEVTDPEKGVDEARIVLEDFNLENGRFRRGDNIISTGNYIRVLFGDGRTQRTVVFRVSKLSGNKDIELTCKNVKHAITQNKKSRVFSNMTRSAVIKQIAEENGIPVIEIQDTAEAEEGHIQFQMSDGQFMNYLAYREGKQLSITQRGLKFAGRKYNNTPTFDMTYHYGKGEILDYELETDITRFPGKVRSSGMSKKSHKQKSTTADNSTETDRDVLTRNTGSVNLQANTGKDFIMGTEEVQTEGDDTAKDAKSRYVRAQQRAVKLKVWIVGDASFVPTRIGYIRGINEIASGLYYVKKVVHTVNSSGFETELSLMTTGLNKGSGGGRNSKPISAQEVLSQCIRDIREDMELDKVNGRTGMRTETIGFLSLLQTLEANGQPLSNTDLQKVLRRSQQLAENLERTQPGYNVNKAIRSCNAEFYALSGADGDTERSQGTVNEKKAVDPKDAVPTLRTNLGGPVGATLRGRQSDVESLGNVNEDIRVEYTDSVTASQGTSE